MANRKLCKKVLEEHFKVPFKRTTINEHVIDFYNKDLKIGLVYNSIHHYEYSPKFHKTYCKFIELQRRDKLKRKACREKNIELITISYDEMCVVGWIRERLKIPNDCSCLSCLVDCLINGLI